MAQKRTERKRQSKVAKETGILQLVRSMHLKTAALDTPRVARQHCMIRHRFGTLRTLAIQASTPFLCYTSTTISQL